MTAAKYAFISVAVAAGLYTALLALLTTSTFQSHAVYLHAIQMTWCKDLDVPKTFGFLKNQVTPFSIKTSDSIILVAPFVNVATLVATYRVAGTIPVLALLAKLLLLFNYL
ncbi:hypothetical protein VE00_09735 [Pseudogymnoascus sp. WSF 3629]|nr:hypothetical protein VE00_09735 [Pseudogymnoascus sp. WSF 3629]